MFVSCCFEQLCAITLWSFVLVLPQATGIQFQHAWFVLAHVAPLHCKYRPKHCHHSNDRGGSIGWLRYSKLGGQWRVSVFFLLFLFSCNPSNDLTLLRVFFLFYPRYVGTGECVVFQIKPGPFRMYNWTGKNSYFMLGNAPLFAFVLLHTHS